MAEYLKQAAPWASQSSDDVRQTVSEMLSRIEREGLDAVRDYSRRLDSWDPPSFVVDESTIRRSADPLSEELQTHIAYAQQQVQEFARRQRETMTDLEVELRPGVVLGHKHIPVDGVGSYVPGGRYPMLASSFMTVLVPKVAGVPRVVACAPPWHGEGIHPAMLYAISTSGADQILCVGGVQALAMVAFGLGGVEPVDMIVGAGNAYVAEAKRQLFGRVGIDLLAGPSEITVIADDGADVELVAADLLGQAEHGPTSPVVLICLSEAFGRRVIEEAERQLAELGDDTARAAWTDYGSVIVAADREEAAQVSDAVAPEHLEVHAADEDWWLARLREYGSLFLGSLTTVAFSDKGTTGTNHVLPTGRAARYSGGLSALRFVKTLTYQRVTDPEASRPLAEAVAEISAAEGLPAHGATATRRLARLENPSERMS